MTYSMTNHYYAVFALRYRLIETFKRQRRAICRFVLQQAHTICDR